MLHVPNGIWGTLCPSGNVGTLCPSTVPPLCQDGTRMLRVPNWNGGTQHRASRALSLARTLLIPQGNRGRATCTPSPPGRDAPHSAGAVCPGCVRGLFAISPGAACGRARCQPQAGEGGAGAAGARAGERSPASGRGGGTGEVAPALGRDSGPGGHGDMARLLPLLLLAALGCAARPGRRPAPWDDGALAQRPPARGCANLTLVLDNWKFAITSQLRNLLLSDHQTVLPDYGRIPALSGALDELYRDFRGLKEQLGRLSDRFAHLEASVEQLSRARGAAAPPRRGGVPQNPRRAPGTPP
nr:uncharacterized protein LOC129127971 [Agelaius phoeniceus]